MNSTFFSRFHGDCLHPKRMVETTETFPNNHFIGSVHEDILGWKCHFVCVAVEQAYSVYITIFVQKTNHPLQI
jgi:hypothetical protein